MNSHVHYMEPELLEVQLNRFAVGGQFQMITKEAMYRGEIEKCLVLAERRVVIHFKWLCERRFCPGSFWRRRTLQSQWSLLTRPLYFHNLDVEYRWFYL